MSVGAVTFSVCSLVTVTVLWPIHLTGVTRQVNAPCAAAHTRASQAPRKPPGAYGPFVDPERPPWNAHPLGAPSEPPNSPTPVKWIGQSDLIRSYVAFDGQPVL